LLENSEVRLLKYLSPLTVSKTLHALVRRVLKTHPDRWKILRFDMGADHSPVTGKPPPHFDRWIFLSIN